MRPKIEGPEEMVTTWQDEQRVFGLVVTKDKLKAVDELRINGGRPPLKEIPETRFLLVHGNKNQDFCG